MNTRRLLLLPVLASLSAACMVPPTNQPTETPSSTASTAIASSTSAPTTAATEPAASVASSGATEAPLPPSELKVGGVSLSYLTPQQMVAVLAKVGYQARASHPKAFGGRPVWDDRFIVFSFELLKNKSVVGTLELVRPVDLPVEGRKAGTRTAAAFIKDALDEARGLIDGNGVVDAPSDTALTAVVSKTEVGSALEFLTKVMKQE